MNLLLINENNMPLQGSNKDGIKPSTTLGLKNLSWFKSYSLHDSNSHLIIQGHKNNKLNPMVELEIIIFPSHNLLEQVDPPPFTRAQLHLLTPFHFPVYNTLSGTHHICIRKNKITTGSTQSIPTHLTHNAYFFK